MIVGTKHFPVTHQRKQRALCIVPFVFEVLRVIESKSTTKQRVCQSKSTLGDPGAIKFRARGTKIGVTGDLTNVYQDVQKSSYQTSSKRLVEFWLMNGQKNPLYYSAPKKDKKKKVKYKEKSSDQEQNLRKTTGGL